MNGAAPMQAAGIEQFGASVGPLSLPDPRPLAADEVLIEVRAAGVGNWDEFVRLGQWDLGREPPMALGVEVAGVIAKTGDAVDGWSVGDAVMAHPLPLRDQGAWAQRLVVASELLAAKPEQVSWAQAATFPVPALTAHQALSEGVRLRSEDRLLVHGAGGVTGRFLARLACLSGARVVATAGPSSAEALSRLGVESVLDYHDDGWPQAARELTGGVTAAVNAVPGQEARALSTVADGGRFATITGSPPEPERGVTIANVYVRPDGAQLRELAGRFARGELTIGVGAVYELERAQEALSLVTGGGAGGAVALAAAVAHEDAAG
jgi:NADPH:quinone reductase-like Zn-dependent oxidoreductase